MEKLIKIAKKENPFDIDPDTIFFSDLHLHDRKEFERIDPLTGLNFRLTEGLNVLSQIAHIISIHPNINLVYHLGDVFELKDRVPNHILIEFGTKMDLIIQNARFISLMGNHDYNVKNYPILSLFRYSKRAFFNFIDKPKHYDTTYFIPFQRNWEDFKQEWMHVHNQSPKPTIICIHQGVPGAVYETGKPIDGVWDLKTDPNILYLSGHLHKPQKVHGIQFLGGPYHTKFSDEGQNRYIWLYNSLSKKLKPLKLDYSKFISLNYNYDLGHKDLHSIVKGNYIRIVGDVNKEDMDNSIKNTLKEQLYKLGAKAVIFNIKIIQSQQLQMDSQTADTNTEIIRRYAKENIKDSNLNLEKLMAIGEEVYANIKI